MAHYSALFTLGLLSERGSPPSSRSNSPTLFKFRKSSLPTFSPSSSSFSFSVQSDEHLQSPVEFSDPFGAQPPRQQSLNDFRSFLSLDLAETQSQRAPKRDVAPRSAISPLDTSAASLSPLATQPMQPHSPASRSPHYPIPSYSPSSQSPLPNMNSRRPSRDSLRNLPSPKPAPVSTLPEIPSARGVPKALRSVPALSIAPMSPSSSSSSPQSPSHRPSYSAPPYAPVASTSSPTHSRRMSYISFSSTGTSVRTSRKRTAHRSDALAHLEGRAGMPRRPMPPRARNFMNMTDDEDEEDDFPVAPRDVAHSRLTVPASIHMQVPPSSPTYYDDEDRVLPAPITHSRSLPQSRASMSSLSPPPSVKGGRRRRSTIESWFPLANFIDLKDDDLASWRGLVEIASAL